MVWLSNRWKILLMLAPSFLVFSLFVVYPLIYSAVFSFSRFRGFGAPTWIGFDNYTALLNDPFFWQSLRNTAIILVLSLAVLIPASFALALLLQSVKRGGGLLRALVFGPAIIAPILVGLIWVFILDPRIGLLNRALGAMGVSPIKWIGGDHLSPVSVSITNIFKIFELVYMLTGGGPVHRSETLVSYMYWVTFTNQQYGYGMALAVVVTVLGALISVGYLVAMRRRKEVAA